MKLPVIQKNYPKLHSYLGVNGKIYIFSLQVGPFLFMIEQSKTVRNARRKEAKAKLEALRKKTQL